ncbi:MAG: alpha/beta hydrolase [Streptosporangiaceae bacterium]
MRAPRLVAVIVALFASVALAGPPAQALDNPYQRGPAPTVASIQAVTGPFAVSQATVPAGSGPGFNKGTLYYPTSTAEGSFGGVAIIPGFTGPEFSIAWYGPRLASQGFVVFTLEPTSILDFPDARADQLLAGLDYLASASTVRDRVDPNRLAVMGHSMGGGGTLRAADKRPSLRAAIPLAPWHFAQDWSKVKVPTLVIASDNDFIAPPASHAAVFYDSLTSTPDKAYLLLKNAGHAQYILPNTTTAQYSIAWLKRFVDDDARYEQFLCPAPAVSATIAKYLDTCPS